MIQLADENSRVVEDVRAEPVAGPAKFDEAATCSSDCKVHWRLRLASVAMIVGGVGLYGMLEFAPWTTNAIPKSMLNLISPDRNQGPASLAKEDSQPPTVDMGLPVESFVGTTACALCEHGVSPIHGARTKGLALALDDGRIAVVENAHNYYPEAYRIRERHLKAVLTGRVVHSERNVIWVHPASLDVDSNVTDAATSK